MKLTHLTLTKALTPTGSRSNCRSRTSTNRSKSNQTINDTTRTTGDRRPLPRPVPGAESVTLKQFIECVIAEQLGPIHSLEDELAYIFFD
jgi:hypothetical protein